MVVVGDGRRVCTVRWGVCEQISINEFNNEN